MHLTTEINPSQNIIEKESEHILLCFCTYCTLLKGKKLSFQNVFILVLQDENLRDILKELLGMDSNYDVVKLFLSHDPGITNSKYVTRFTAQKNKLCF